MLKKKNAIYLRLSIEDKRNKAENGLVQEESNSISSQRKMLIEFIKRDEKLTGRETVEFCDDGFSGTSMNRPGIQELLKEVKQGKIDCILVKDMSRFSRDYIDLGTYLNQIFPFMGIRFIAVNDHYDSEKNNEKAIGIDTTFRTLLYDFYSKDLSVKVKTSFWNKCENGEYVFGQVPFGYEKSKKEKNMVMINKKEAEIVRKIFSMADSGMSSVQIAKELYREEIPTCTQMRYPQRKQKKEYSSWSGEMVRAILKNRFYLGEMTYGKRVSKFVGSKSMIAVPKEEWKAIRGHHEALVTSEMFARVASCMQGGSPKRKREKHPLTGKIYCGGCGYSINFKPKGKGKMPDHFWCRKHALLQIPECCTYFRADILEELVLFELYQELMCQGNLARQRESLEKIQKIELQRVKQEWMDSKGECRKLTEEKNLLYERYALREIGVEEYRKELEAKELKIREFSCKMKECEADYTQLEEEYKYPKMEMKQIIRFSKMGRLTQEIVDAFIKRVTVYRGKKVEIEWAFDRL